MPDYTITETSVPMTYVHAALYRAKEEAAFLQAWVDGATFGDGAFQRVRTLATEAQEASRA